MLWISNLAAATLARPAEKGHWLLNDRETRIAEIVKREFFLR
ncbi:hypothetical protein [Mesorhizobium sp.]|nr:hypothetical protein [Mesorhizobium sp.]